MVFQIYGGAVKANVPPSSQSSGLLRTHVLVNETDRNNRKVIADEGGLVYRMHGFDL